MSLPNLSIHFMYASMYVFLCHLIPERMADGLQGYIKYKKRSIKNRNKMPTRKKKVGNVNVSSPEVTFTKFSWLPFKRGWAHREETQDNAGWAFRECTSLRHQIISWKSWSLLPIWWPGLLGSHRMEALPPERGVESKGPVFRNQGCFRVPKRKPKQDSTWNLRT